MTTAEDTVVTVDLRTLVTDVETGDDALIFTVAGATNGTVELLDGHTARFTPTGQYNGPASFTYSVQDTGDGAAAAITVGPVSISVTVTPVNDAPVALPTALTTAEDAAVEVDLRTLVSDVETANAALSFTVGGAANGAVQLVDGHIARFTPGANFNNNRGSASFTYSVTDTGDGTAAAKTVGPITISVSVTPVNDAPVTGDDSRAVANDEPTTINVLANDTDPDLVEGDTISIVSVTQGSRNGTVVIDNGKIVYTPVDLLGGEGTETFSYTIRDTAGLTATQVVTLTVVANSPPVAEPDTASTNEDAIIGGNVLTNDHDDDGNPLEVIAFDATSAQGAAVTVAADGTFSYNPTGAAALQALSNGELLDDTFTYTISDGQGGTAIGTVTVHVTGMNDAPTATAKTGATDEDTTLGKPAGFLLDGAHDPDAHDTLSINVGASDATSAKGATVTIQADGSFVYDPTGSAQLQGLAQGQSTTDTFLFTVDDGNGGQYSAVVTITVTGLNDQPTARADSFQTNEDTPLVADETRNVLDNDTDPDTTDVLTVVGADSASVQGAAVTVHSDGTFSYNPGSLFNHLAVGESAQDSFSYTMSDGHVTKTATVTVTITGVNDEPTAVADSAATGKSTVINIDVVDNDTDPDTSDVLVVGTFAPTSTRGATITKNGDGTLKYDPRGSVQLQALGTGQQLVDTFTYAVSDGHGGSSTATVSVTVTGSSDALYVANPIADMTLTDATSPQPGLINLNTVFDAPDGVSLSFVATSSNQELVHVSIVGGNQLQVTYVTYTTGQDRTPAVVTVTATDNTPQANHVSDQFNVTVNPEDTVGVYLVVRQTATPVGQASGNTLPTSLDEVAVGSTYVVEVWMQDVYGASVTGGPSEGLTGGEFDIAFNKTLGQATGLNFEGPYFAAPPFQTGTINNGTGLIDDFGSGVITKGLSVAPLYTRLGYTTFTASAAGTQSFTLSEPTVARFGSGNIDLTQLNLGSASVDQVVPMQSLTFTVSSRSTMQISGTVLGATLEPTSGSSDMAAGLTGTLQVLVDNPANPTRLSIASGSLDVTTNVPEGKFLPGPGGTDVPAYADFAFTAEPGGDLVQLALRELLISLSTDEIQTLSGPASAARFDASMIDSPVAAGFADVRSSGLGGSRVDLTGLVAEPAIDETGILNTSGTVYDLTFVYRWTIDLSAWFPNTVLTIDGTYVAEYDTGAGIVGTAVAAEAPTVAQMTLVKEPTTVDANGQVSALPQSEAWIDEWDGYWVEVWVKTSEAPGITAGSVDLAYNPDYFTATEIDHGTVYVDGATGNLDQDGLVSGLGGIATLGNVGGAGYTLLGRVKFESLGDDGVAMDAENQVLAPHDLGLELSNARIEGAGVGALDAAVGRAPQTVVWAVPYDVDDSGRIDLGDLSYFAATYRDDVLTSDTPFVWALDFDHTGSVDMGDLSFLASNYGLSRGGAADVVFPENFLQSWVGAGLDVQGETAVGDLLDAAIATWQDLLGLDQPLDIQLVVEDFGTSQLGQGQILEVDADGVPILGRVTIDDDANGLGWYSQLDSLPGEGQYDLYTVLLHEVGHTLGFMQSYEGFGSQVQTDAQGDTVFVGSDFTAPLDASGQHIDAGVLPDDAMTASLSPGVRKLPSELDARILLAAYEAASGGASGFAAMSAAMVADDATAGTLAGSTSTADFDRLDGKLEGDVTWDRLLGSRSGQDLSATDAAAPTDAQADAVDALPASGLAVDLAGSTLSPTRARHALRVRDDSGDLGSDEILVELAATRDLRPDRPHTLDALFSEWDDFVVKDATNR
ncbi:MAG: Ig-like domain-containing protein [Planctomycetia bacterium]|nr:Ig-like domain-containing protein [Planctomycetia bacterium]